MSRYPPLLLLSSSSDVIFFLSLSSSAFVFSRSAGSCSSSVCRLLDDGGGGVGGDKTPPPCWCRAETTTAVGDPNYNTAAGRTTTTTTTTATGYRCPPRGALSQRRTAVAADTNGVRPPPRSRTASSNVQSNVHRPPSRIVPSRCVSAGDWCCDNRGNVDDDDDCFYDYSDDDDDEVDRRATVDGVRDDNRVRVMNNGPVMTCDVGGAQQGRGGVGGPDAKPPAERTYASTEAQTDETACSSAYREQRRRERRERRQQQRRVHPPPPPPPALASPSLLLPPPPLSAVTAAAAVSVDPDRLPDLLLNSPHLPPPLYTTVGGGGIGVCDVAMRTANLQSLLPASFQHPHHQPPVGSSAAANSPGGGFRLPFGIIPARRRRFVEIIFVCL